VGVGVLSGVFVGEGAWRVLRDAVPNVGRVMLGIGVILPLALVRSHAARTRAAAVAVAAALAVFAAYAVIDALFRIR
jgi:hypothetical protein